MQGRNTFIHMYICIQVCIYTHNAWIKDHKGNLDDKVKLPHESYSSLLPNRVPSETHLQTNFSHARMCLHFQLLCICINWFLMPTYGYGCLGLPLTPIVYQVIFVLIFIISWSSLRSPKVPPTKVKWLPVCTHVQDSALRDLGGRDRPHG